MPTDSPNQENTSNSICSSLPEQTLATLSPKPTHLPFLDLLRGVAILCVFLHHALGAATGYYAQPWKGLFPDFFAAKTYWPLFPLTIGNCGVAIFFVVSGFCIHLSHSRSANESWYSFCVKRFFRIYPPYLIALLVFYLSWPWRTYSLSSPGWIHQFWTHFFLIHNNQAQTAFAINGSFWSIAVEAQLYLIYPLLLLIVAVIGWRYSLIVLFLLEVAIRMSIIPGIDAFDSLHLSPLGFWFSWSLGAYMAHRYLNRQLPRYKKVYFYFAIIFALFSYLLLPLEKFQFMAVSLLTAIIIWRNIYSSKKQSDYKFAPFSAHLVALGTISYSFYLIHQPLLLLIQRFNDHFAPQGLNSIVLVLICLMMYVPVFYLAKFFYFSVERTSISLGKLFLV
jgi:peptidoglycan/LPS O-acetylase OafA/YrhL